jgi:hypothetical protein
LASIRIRILCGGRALEHVFEDINIYSPFLLFKILSTVDVHDYFLQEIGIFFVKSFISPVSVSNFSGSQSLAIST